jgi:hypothetical protein
MDCVSSGQPVDIDASNACYMLSKCPKLEVVTSKAALGASYAIERILGSKGPV